MWFLKISIVSLRMLWHVHIEELCDHIPLVYIPPTPPKIQKIWSGYDLPQMEVAPFNELGRNISPGFHLLDPLLIICRGVEDIWGNLITGHTRVI